MITVVHGYMGGGKGLFLASCIRDSPIPVTSNVVLQPPYRVTDPVEAERTHLAFPDCRRQKDIDTVARMWDKHKFIDGDQVACYCGRQGFWDHEDLWAGRSVIIDETPLFFNQYRYRGAESFANWVCQHRKFQCDVTFVCQIRSMLVKCLREIASQDIECVQDDPAAGGRVMRWLFGARGLGLFRQLRSVQGGPVLSQSVFHRGDAVQLSVLYDTHAKVQPPSFAWLDEKGKRRCPICQPQNINSTIQPSGSSRSVPGSAVPSLVLPSWASSSSGDMKSPSIIDLV